MEGCESNKIESVGMLCGGGGMMGTFNFAPEEEKSLDNEIFDDWNLSLKALQLL